MQEARRQTIFGHPTGLFVLFFAEMWERFSYYGMRALLVFYMLKGFLGLTDYKAYGIYGAYTALVYMTPYFGGMLADRLLGRRKAVILGGMLMAAGHLLMTIEHSLAFFTALGLLIMGNGFFKPNISTIVSELYEKMGLQRLKDTGFTIFYMGINLGAAMAPIVCGYVGETYGWHYGFGLATVGMLVGLAIFVAPTRITQLLIGVGAILTAIAMPFWQDSPIQLAIRLFLSIALVVSAGIAVVALNRAPLPHDAGAPPSPALLGRRIAGILTVEHLVYLGAVVCVFVMALFVKHERLAGWLLGAAGIAFLIYILWEMLARSQPVERDRMTVALVLFVFNMLFWAFFEQAGSSLNNWTDRNVDRAVEKHTITEKEMGKTITFRVQPRPQKRELLSLPLLSQEQLGFINADTSMWRTLREAMLLVEHHRNKTRENPLSDTQVLQAYEALKKEGIFTLTALTYLREAAALSPDERFQTVQWLITEQNIGMGIAYAEVPASEFQAANPIYILLFGLLFSALWNYLEKRGRDPSAPVKFSLGLLQLGAGFLLFWLGTHLADERGMTSPLFLLGGWLVITTGELCLSPVGLSMVTKLSPTRLVSTMMGGWFLSTAFSNYLAGMIAKLTGEEHAHSAHAIQLVPPPQETASLYGEVFGMLGLIAVAAAVICFLLSSLLTRLMHGAE